MMNEERILQMKKINKSFSGVQVLHDVDFEIKRGEVRALAGENGAGKSTLMKILGGIYDADSGEIWINGQKANIESVQDAKDLGVAIIHQEIVLVQEMTIGENIFLGREYKDKVGLVDYQKMYQEASVILERIGMGDLRPDTLVRELSISKQQMVEIARAISTDSKIIVMDEPTSSLTDREVKFLFEQIEALSKKDVSVIYISHKMDEIFEICDSITIMRDGKIITTDVLENISYEKIIQSMVGHKIEDYYPQMKIKSGKEVLRVENLTTEKVKDISFSLSAGEILGITGLMGAGRTELVSALYGLDEIQSGKIYLDGRECAIKCPRDAIKKQIVLVPEDRKENGLFLDNSISFNMTIAVMKKFMKGIHIDRAKEQDIIDKYTNLLGIKMAGTEQLAVELSGGNQQKIVISKWLAANPRILILDEPTRGVDVGAKSDIYHLISQIVESGVAIILISSELPEVMNMSSRIGVMCEGQLVKIFEPGQETVTQENIMHYATGGYKHETLS